MQMWIGFVGIVRRCGITTGTASPSPDIRTGDLAQRIPAMASAPGKLNLMEPAYRAVSFPDSALRMAGCPLGNPGTGVVNSGSSPVTQGLAAVLAYQPVPSGHLAGGLPLVYP